MKFYLPLSIIFIISLTLPISLAAQEIDEDAVATMGQQERLDAFTSEVIWSRDLVAVETGTTINTQYFKGRHRIPLEGREVYDSLGEEELGDQYQSRKRRKYWMVGGGITLGFVGSVVGPVALLQSGENSCDSSCQSLFIGLGIASIASSLLGYISLFIGMRSNPHPIEAHELNVLIENHNRGLMQDFEIDRQDLPEEEENSQWRDSLRVDIYSPADGGGGVMVGFQF